MITRLPALALLLAALPFAAPAAARVPQEPDGHGNDRAISRAQRFLERGDHERAAAEFAAIVAESPGDGFAWHQLGLSLHQGGRFEEAADANLRAAEFPPYRASGLYNLACARSRMGRSEEAVAALERSLEAGFFDYDLLETDPDLAPLREAGLVELPPAAEYASYRHSNGVEIPYRLLVPEGHDPTRPTPAVALFAPGSGGPRSADWVLAELGRGVRDEGWIVLVMCAPSRRGGWYSHPAHHALEGLLKKVRRAHEVEGESFHLLGFGVHGSGPAVTYSGMSGRFFRSFTAVSSASLDDPERLVRRYRDLPVHLVAGSLDPLARPHAERAAAVFSEAGLAVTLHVVEGEDARVPGMRGRRLVEVLSGAGTRTARAR